jgi:hypothetical protein
MNAAGLGLAVAQRLAVRHSWLAHAVSMPRAPAGPRGPRGG